MSVIDHEEIWQNYAGKLWACRVSFAPRADHRSHCGELSRAAIWRLLLSGLTIFWAVIGYGIWRLF